MSLFPCFNAWIIICHERISHSLIHSSVHPHVLPVVSSLGIGNVAAMHALWHVVFKICVFLRYHKSGESLSYFLFFFSIKARGQWFLYQLLPLICPHYYKRIPLTNVNLPFLVWSVFQWPFPVLRVDVPWQFGFCISDKKPYGILFMGFLLFESTLICIYLLMFSSWECPICVCVCVCVCVFIYLFNFGCMTPDMFNVRCHVESSSLVNIRCLSAIVFMLRLQSKSSTLKAFFILSSFRMACTTWQFYSGLVVH